MTGDRPALPEGPSRLSPCSRSGACCRGRGTTPLRPEDVTRLARSLGRSEADLFVTHLARRDGRVELRTRPGARHDLECVFLEGNLCSVHGARPKSCRTWPLWKSLVEDGEVFEKAKADCAMLATVDHAALRRIWESSSPSDRSW